MNATLAEDGCVFCGCSFQWNGRDYGRKSLKIKLIKKQTIAKCMQEIGIEPPDGDLQKIFTCHPCMFKLTRCVRLKRSRFHDKKHWESMLKRAQTMVKQGPNLLSALEKLSEFFEGCELPQTTQKPSKVPKQKETGNIRVRGNPEHGSHFLKYFYKLLKKQELTDMTLQCGDSQFDVHSVILSAFSKYFQTVLSTTEADDIYHVDISSKNLSKDTVSMVLEYLYTGEVVYDEILLREAAVILEIPSLLENITKARKATKARPKSTIPSSILSHVYDRDTDGHTQNVSLPDSYRDEETLNLVPTAPQISACDAMETPGIPVTMETSNIAVTLDITEPTSPAQGASALDLLLTCESCDVPVIKQEPDDWGSYLDTTNKVVLDNTSTISAVSGRDFGDFNDFDVNCPLQVTRTLDGGDAGSSCDQNEEKIKIFVPEDHNYAAIYISDDDDETSPSCDQDKNKELPSNSLNIYDIKEEEDDTSYDGLSLPEFHQGRDNMSNIQLLNCQEMSEKENATTFLGSTVTCKKLETMKKIIVPLFICQLCNKKFLKQEFLDKHRKAVHSEECSEAEKVLNVSDHRSTAEINCENVEDRSYNEFQAMSTVQEVSEVMGTTESPPASRKKPTFYCCKYCDKKYISKKRLGVHIRTAHKHKYNCSQCKKQFIYKTSLDKHVHKDHVIGKPKKLKKPSEPKEPMPKIECEYCGKVYSYPERLENHIQLVHVLNVKKVKERRRHIPCHICGEKYFGREALAEHKKEKHTEHYCDYCGKQFDKRTLLKIHLRTVHRSEIEEYKNPSFLCDICGKSYPTKGALSNHKNNSHSNNSRTTLGGRITNKSSLLCDDCGKTFIGKAALVIHKKYSHSNFRRKVDRSTGPVKCEKCDKTFLNSIRLRLHTRRVHLAVDIVCSMCGSVLKNKSGLREHMFEIHGVGNKKPSTCKECGETFVTRRLLKRHTGREHRRNEQCSCETCGKVFSFKTALWRHKKTCPAVEQGPFLCDICGVSYDKKASLVLHNKYTHTQEPITGPNGELQCQKCSKTLADASSFEAHMQTVHKIVKSPCHLCNIVLYSKSSLIRHLRKQHGCEGPASGPQTCHLCGDQVKSYIALKKHVQTFHKGEKYKCELCEKELKNINSYKSHLRKYHPQPGKIFSCSNGCPEVFDLYNDLHKHQLGCPFVKKKVTIARDEYDTPERVVDSYNVTLNSVPVMQGISTVTSEEIRTVDINEIIGDS